MLQYLDVDPPTRDTRVTCSSKHTLW